MRHRIEVNRPSKKSVACKAFSLLELSIVMVIVSTVAVMGLEVSNQFILRRAYNETQQKLERIDAALVQFYRVNGRLPCPANRTYTPSNTSFGVESCTATANLAWSGTIPFRTLNLPFEEVVDAYGNQFNFVLSKDMESASTFSTATAVITVRTGRLNLPCTVTCQVLTTTAAYAVFSAGPNKEGGASRTGVTTSCILNDGSYRPDQQNCAVAVDAPAGVVGIGYLTTTLYDNRFNTGVQPTNYFDDIILWRNKGRVL